MGRPSNAAKQAKALMENPDKNADQEMNENSSKKSALLVMRRSCRLHKKMFQSRSKMVKQDLLGEISISDSEEEDEHLKIERNNGLPELQRTGDLELPKTEDRRSLEEKVEYLLQAVDELKSKKYEICNDQHPRNSPLNNVKCVGSQTEIESLREENNQLCKKLDIALGKVEAVYAEGNRTLVDTLKEVILSPNLARTSKTVTLLLPSEEDTMARDTPLKEQPVAAKKQVILSPKKRGRKPRQVV